MALVKSRSDFYAETLPTAKDVLLLVEVADTSAAFDRAIKLPLYAAAGIVEVWLIDLAENRVEVYRQPAQQGYQEVQQVERGRTLSPLMLFDFAVIVDEVLGLN